MPANTYMKGKMLINGELVESVSGQRFDSLNPATEEIIGSAPLANVDDVDIAFKAAERAQAEWSETDMGHRIKVMTAFAEALEARTDEIAELEVRDTGNTIKPMRQDVVTAADRIRLYAGLGYELKGETIPATASGLHITMREPYGVVGRIIPFNHPIGFAASRLAPALIAGNAILIKPPEQSPLSACILAEICKDHFPPGLVNILTGEGATGDAIVRHPGIKRIAFIGSVPTGMKIQHSASEVAVKNISLELGGKNPLIACPDADVDQVATAAIRGMNFAWQGQSCGSTSRILLHESLHDAVVEKMVAKLESMSIGNPLDPAIDMGPMNSRKQYDRVMSLIETAKFEGAECLVGGGRPQGKAYEKGYWIQPTLFRGVNTDMTIAKTEVFGPVVSIFKWTHIEDAIRIANDVEYGLTAAIYTQDFEAAMYLSKKVNVGYVWINGTNTHFRNVPYGGFKNSGIGREEGLDELLSYTELKAINWTPSTSSAAGSAWRQK
ncbi:aldehyde dehydrogenase family protein [Litorivicinus sp.]|nr:aldehyde dehydrogenase family protein [Litorivicinus sp.]